MFLMWCGMGPRVGLERHGGGQRWLAVNSRRNTLHHPEFSRPPHSTKMVCSGELQFSRAHKAAGKKRTKKNLMEDAFFIEENLAPFTKVIAEKAGSPTALCRLKGPYALARL